MPSESRGSSDQSQSEGSQSDSSSDDFDLDVSSFLKAFPNPPLLMRDKSGFGHGWVFCSQSENNSSSVDVGVPMNIIHDKIISAFSNIDFRWWSCLAQFWEPVTIHGRLLLSNFGQPFVVTHLNKDFVEYRLDSEKYKYIIDVKNKLHTEGDPMFSSGGPATAFLNRFPYTIVPLEENDDERGKLSFMLPVCFQSQSSCVGVLELNLYHTLHDVTLFILYVINEIKIAGLDVCNVQKQIPYKTINGLRAVKKEIEHALQIVCGLHDISLAQVWIGAKDKSHMPLSSYSGDTQRVFGLKLTGYLLDEHAYEQEMYNRLCNVMPRRCTEKHALKTLQDFKSRYISTLNDDVLLSGEVDNFMAFSKNMASLVICLRSNDTGDFNYAFEFIWQKHSNYAILLEAILSTLKRCLPSFKFASGAELDDESDVIKVHCFNHNQTHIVCIPTYNEICNFKIFQGKTSSPIPKPLEVGKQPTVVDYIATSKKTTPEVLPLEYTQKHLYGIGDESPTTSSIKVVQGKRLSPISKSVEEGKKPMVKFKTDEILLTREDIEKHFDKTMKEAAKNLKVSESTLKRKLRKLGIEEWPRTKPVKRNKNDLSINQIETNEEDNGAIQEPSTMTIKAEYAGRMIKTCLLISQATFETIVKEIGVKFKLSLGTYDVTYLDEDGDWILLTSDEDMSDCIKSSRKLDRILVRLRVLPSTN